MDASAQAGRHDVPASSATDLRARVSIVIVLYGSEDTLAACLRSLRDVVESGFGEVIAVDNASPDGSAALLSELLPQGRMITLSENRGFAGGVNAALPEARLPYVLLLNPDVVLPREGLLQLVAWMDRHPKVGVASPELLSEDGVRRSPGYAFPSAGIALMELMRLHRLLPRSWRGRLLRGPYWLGGDQLDAGWVPGTAMIVRAEALAAVGPLDETFFMYGEDLEWCWRFREAGWSVGVCADVAFQHREGSSAGTVWDEPSRLQRVAEGIITAAIRARGKRHATVFALATGLNLALESIHPRRPPLNRERTRAWLKAWWAALRMTVRR